MGLFGPSKEEVWKELCEEIKGTLINEGFWKGSRVEVQYKNWKIYLDTYTVSTGKSSITYTRLRAPFVHYRDFHFKIYERFGIISDIGKALGMQDIEIGDSEFDKKYIIQGNNESIVKSILSNTRVKDLIYLQPRIKLETKNNEGIFGPNFKDNESQLYFLVTGVIKDVQLLKIIFELFSVLLDEMALQGVISEDTPSVQLYK
ncbi:hypothetical protein EDC18_101514 [Natranaerovirga pectinivora]|uniref:DUF3137 domain-containing protein n=1 Tax=Natranaerovirga pectinivora TaxID=682400 RepID=A0A4R3MV78_9FIRM|nr:DUF3137 domain-containing protein [Natranaerovirga pectinivora]TCT17216.1 hypothetical protein EDC18_101514 [Natranaerovirga pectinivora]